MRAQQQITGKGGISTNRKIFFLTSKREINKNGIFNKSIKVRLFKDQSKLSFKPL